MVARSYTFGTGTQLDKLFLTQLQIVLDELSTAIDTNTTSITALKDGFEPGLIKQPQNQDYRIVERFPFAATIERFTVKLASGTCTVALKIDGVTVGNCSLNATSSQSTTTTVAPKTVSIASVISLTISSNSNAVDLSWQFDWTRT